MTSPLEEQIAQFRKMATEDPTNELGHFRLGKLLLDAGRPGEAAESLRRTVELNDLFSKAYELLGQALLQAGRKDEAVDVLRRGFDVADGRGDFTPRDTISRLLQEAGEPAPTSKRAAGAGPAAQAGAGGFRCQRPTCMAGAHARQLPGPPFNDDLGRRIQQNVCADCWNSWVRDFSVKVINEMRLNLSTEAGQREYDRVMLEFLGLEG